MAHGTAIVHDVERINHFKRIVGAVAAGHVRLQAVDRQPPVGTVNYDRLHPSQLDSRNVCTHTTRTYINRCMLFYTVWICAHRMTEAFVMLSTRCCRGMASINNVHKLCSAHRRGRCHIFSGEFCVAMHSMVYFQEFCMFDEAF